MGSMHLQILSFLDHKVVSSSNFNTTNLLESTRSLPYKILYQLVEVCEEMKSMWCLKN